MISETEDMSDIWTKELIRTFNKFLNKWYEEITNELFTFFEVKGKSKNYSYDFSEKLSNKKLIILRKPESDIELKSKRKEDLIEIDDKDSFDFYDFNKISHYMKASISIRVLSNYNIKGINDENYEFTNESYIYTSTQENLYDDSIEIAYCSNLEGSFWCRPLDASNQVSPQ